MSNSASAPSSDQTALSMTGGQRRVYGVLRGLLHGAARAWFRVSTSGTERIPTHGAFILAPGGHRSILDTPMVALAAPNRVLRYMGAETYFETPLLGGFLRSMGGFPVERAAADRVALRAAEGVLAAGEPLVVFPEGTRQSGPTVAELKSGAAFLACRAQVPIVPVGIGGAERALPKGSRLPRRRRVHLEIGIPLLPPSTDGGTVKRSAIAALNTELHQTLQELFDQAQRSAAD